MTTPAPPSLPELQDRVAAVMRRDEDRLRRRLVRVAGLRDDAARERGLEEVVAELAEAEERLARRRAAVPVPSYPASLPITARRDEILAAIRDHQVVIVAGETGSGKSTQLPKLCLELGRGVRGLVGHTQPRRLAARTVAERIAEELGTTVGDTVGYTVRFTDRVGERTLLKLMTDGVLLAEIQRDRLLTAYDTLIVDEAHERSLNIDFILGYLQQLLPQRPDLKVIVTSATIDTARFAEHFDGAPIIEVSGRTYPVEVRYRPLEDGADDLGDRDQVQGICDAVQELTAEGPGDILVFLSGEREIRDAADALGRLGLRDVELLPLYARLSAADQHRVFQPHRGRRVVLATNVAETSLTVPGIRYVVDPGTARISRYNRRTKVQRLPIEPVSQASANQRAGRCGRVAPGICIRLYDEDDFLARPEYTEPEILRTNLASVILQMAAIGFGDVAAFPFVDPPDARSIKDGLALLEELGALEAADRPDAPARLTPLGRRLARVPLDPRLGRMVIEADRNGCLREVMVIAAALSIQDPRERPSGAEQQAAAELHARFADPDSDFLAYLNLWTYLQELQDELGSSQFRRRCKAEHLHHLRIREWQDIHAQLRVVARSLGLRPTDQPGERDRIHVALLSGLLSHIGVQEAEADERRPGGRRGRRDGRGRPARREYQGARGARFSIAPGSALFAAPPRWVMAAELVETDRLRARVAARIRPEWVERLAGHLVTRTYSEPRWEPRRGAVTADERVTLYGIPIVTGRRVPYGQIDPEVARELFIRHALVEGDWSHHHAVLDDNAALIEEVRALEDRARRRDILVDEEVIFALYDRRVGGDVVSARHFDRWWDEERRRRPDLLRFTFDELVSPAAGGVGVDDYPGTWRQGDLDLDLTYMFAPGDEGDGVTVHVPLPALTRLRPDGFDWQVPGLREDLVTALIRTLPKQTRRLVNPAPDRAREVLARVGPADGPLLEVLEDVLAAVAGVRVPPGSWDLDRVPSHLRMTFQVEDEVGTPLARGKDLEALRRRLQPRVRDGVARAAGGVERAGLRSWEIGTLPRVVEAPWAGHVVTAHPALVDEGDAVAVRALPTPAEQERAMWAGTRRLLLLSVPSPRRTLERQVPNPARLAVAAVLPGTTLGDVLDDCVAAGVDRIVAERGGPAWDEAGFAALLAAVRAGLPAATGEIVRVVGQILVTAQRTLARLDELTTPALLPAVADLRVQLARLLRPGFVNATGAARLPDLLRYLAAVEHRLTRLGDPRDGDSTRRVQALEEDYERLAGARGAGPSAPEVEAVRWMIEELRVSLFAQHLGTAGKVSEPRIRREIDRLAAGG